MKLNGFWPQGYKVPRWLPDWKNEKNYPDPERVSKESFAWEFLRRNPIYQEEYRNLVSLCIEHGVEGEYCVEGGLYIGQCEGDEIKSRMCHAQLYNTLSRFGLYAYLFDPAYEWGENICDAFILRTGSYKTCVDSFLYLEDGLLADNVVIPADGRIIPGENEVLHLFDLSRPLAPQIKIVKRQLEDAQTHRFGRLITKSKSGVEKFPQYLQILDADAVGEADSSIGETLFSDYDTCSYSSDSGVVYKNVRHRNPRADALRDARKGAYSLRDNGYKTLL